MPTADLETWKRVGDAVRRVEREPFPSATGQAEPPNAARTELFVVASDPAEYNGDLTALVEGVPEVLTRSAPPGYRGHVVAYKLRDGLDLSGPLPDVPGLDELLEPGAPLRDWSGQGWVGQYTDPRYGPPVLVNICRHYRGFVWRNQVLECRRLPGFRHSDCYRGPHYQWAAPTFPEIPRPSGSGEPFSPQGMAYDAVEGWSAVGFGWNCVLAIVTAPDPDEGHEWTGDVGAVEDERKWVQARVVTEWVSISPDAFGASGLPLPRTTLLRDPLATFERGASFEDTSGPTIWAVVDESVSLGTALLCTWAPLAWHWCGMRLT